MENDQRQLLKTITSLLDKYKIPYMITGAWSVIYYGRPRASHDIDFVVEIYPHDFPIVLEMLQSLKPDFSFESYTVENEIGKKGVFQVLYLPTFLKFDFWILKDNLFDKSRFKRKKRKRLLGQSMVIATAEDTILQKLRWYKLAKIEKHIVDAAFVYQIQKKNLDAVYLNKWAKTLGVTYFLKELPKIDLDKYL